MLRNNPDEHRSRQHHGRSLNSRTIMYFPQWRQNYMVMKLSIVLDLNKTETCWVTTMQLLEDPQNSHPSTGDATQKTCMPKTHNQFLKTILTSLSVALRSRIKITLEPWIKYEIQRKHNVIKYWGIIHNGNQSSPLFHFQSIYLFWMVHSWIQSSHCEIFTAVHKGQINHYFWMSRMFLCRY
jgi:hypothetical protein